MKQKDPQTHLNEGFNIQNDVISIPIPTQWEPGTKGTLAGQQQTILHMISTVLLYQKAYTLQKTQVIKPWSSDVD